MAVQQGAFKIVFAGLDNSGKTSILYTLEDRFSMLNPSPTHGIERNNFKVLGYPIIRWDLGGQSQFRKTYLQNERTFDATDLLFFVIDIQDRKRFGDAGDYLDHILKMFRKLKLNPPIVLCFHKFDPDLRKSDHIASNMQVAKQVFRRKTAGFDVQMFETTIFEKWTLTDPFSKGILRLSSKSTILDQQLADFAKELNSETILLLDDNALLFGQYTNDSNSNDVCQIVAPHLATMADKIIKYGTSFEIFRVKVEGSWVFFRDLEIDNNRFYLTIHNNREDSVKIIDEKLSQFIERVSNTIQSFFI